MSEYVCDSCGKEYKSNSGLWKHKHKCVPNEEIVMVEDEDTDMASDSLSENEVLEDAQSASTADSSMWNDWNNLDAKDLVTESLPTELKLLTKQQTPKKKGKKLTAAQQKSLDEKSVAILKLGLTFTDTIISFYGQKVTLNPDYVCRHGEKEKTMVAEAQQEALKQHGLAITGILSPTVIALALSGMYVGKPVYKINKKSKKAVIKNGGRKLLSYIPIFGRRFRKKKEVNPFEDGGKINE